MLPRDPGAASGEHGTASAFGSLDGWTLSEALAFLTYHPEFERLSVSIGGYQHFRFADGSEIFIRPKGEIIRLPKHTYGAKGKRTDKGFRIKPGRLLRSEGWHNPPRDEHEWVKVE